MSVLILRSQKKINTMLKAFLIILILQHSLAKTCRSGHTKNGKMGDTAKLDTKNGKIGGTSSTDMKNGKIGDTSKTDTKNNKMGDTSNTDTTSGKMGDTSKTDPELQKIFKKQGKANIVISFKSGIKSTLEKTRSVRHGDRGTHNKFIIEALEKNADSSQNGVLQILNEKRGGSNAGFKYFKQYKSTNTMFVREATADLVQKIANDSQVSMIGAEPLVKWVREVEEDKSKDGDKEKVGRKAGKPKSTWHVEKIQAPEAWEVLGGRKGDGVVVGLLDSGVTGTHEALRDSFRGVNYGWFDPLEKRPEPWDYDRDTSHGSHVAGIIAGTTGSGVAPGAKWMACTGGRNLNYEHLRDCFEWFSCPTLPDGSARDCSKVPHVINNSWESVRNEPGYMEHVLVWRELGIIPVWAAGNGGPFCLSATSPGEYASVISVGITTRKDEHHWGTALGPSHFGPIKPDLSAPGHLIASASKWDDDYTFKTGTSMASPVVAGVVALLKVRDPDLTFDQAYDLLTKNTDKVVGIFEYDPKYFCANQTWTETPNNFFGYGRVNALKAVMAQTEMLKKAGKL